MRFDKLTRKWESLQKEAVFHRVVILGLMLALLLTLWALYTQRSKTRLVPPNLQEEVEVGVNQASKGYKRSWAYYAATIFGNLAPNNASTTMDFLKQMMDPRVYHEYKDAFMEQLKSIKEQDVTITYTPKQIYWGAKERIFVTGQRVRSGPGGNDETETFTYVFRIDINQGRPVITSFDSFQGAPTDEQLEGKAPISEGEG